MQVCYQLMHPRLVLGIWSFITHEWLSFSQRPNVLQDIAKDFEPKHEGGIILHTLWCTCVTHNFTEAKPDDDLLDLMDSTS